jgi:nucleoid-associated protein YgaU
MAFSRYERSAIVDFGSSFGTSFAHTAIRKAIKEGRLQYKEFVVRGQERLDHLAGKHYGSSAYHWVIAAASDIGWGLQVPPGTVIRVPDLAQVALLVG